MEYLQGERIDYYVKTLDNQETIDSMYQLLVEFILVTSLGYNICHGDLHMGNIMVRKKEIVQFIVLDYIISF